MVLKLSKTVHFLEFCADLSKKPKSVKPIYIYVSESPHYTLSENDLVYRFILVILVIIGLFELLAIKISKKILSQHKFKKTLRLETLHLRNSNS